MLLRTLGRTYLLRYSAWSRVLRREAKYVVPYVNTIATLIRLSAWYNNYFAHLTRLLRHCKNCMLLHLYIRTCVGLCPYKHVADQWQLIQVASNDKTKVRAVYCIDLQNYFYNVFVGQCCSFMCSVIFGIVSWGFHAYYPYCIWPNQRIITAFFFYN